jgi:hypothetical protein
VNMFFRVAGIVAVLMLFLGIGVGIGRHYPAVVVQASEQRFQMLDNRVAFDTKTGHKCVTDSIPSGFTTQEGYPSCSEIFKQ